MSTFLKKEDQNVNFLNKFFLSSVDVIKVVGQYDRKIKGQKLIKYTGLHAHFSTISLGMEVLAHILNIICSLQLRLWLTFLGGKRIEKKFILCKNLT